MISVKKKPDSPNQNKKIQRMLKSLNNSLVPQTGNQLTHLMSCHNLRESRSRTKGIHRQFQRPERDDASQREPINNFRLS
jgi:hypothetical protein